MDQKYLNPDLLPDSNEEPEQSTTDSAVQAAMLADDGATPAALVAVEKTQAAETQEEKEPLYLPS
jgi:hypothetical protein